MPLRHAWSIHHRANREAKYAGLRSGCMTIDTRHEIDGTTKLTRD